MGSHEDFAERYKTFESLFERVTKYLNAMCLYLNSRTVLAEIGESEDLMILLIKLLGSKSPYMCLLAS